MTKDRCRCQQQGGHALKGTQSKSVPLHLQQAQVAQIRRSMTLKETSFNRCSMSSTDLVQGMGQIFLPRFAEVTQMLYLGLQRPANNTKPL
jgi:hypothetical protein